MDELYIRIKSLRLEHGWTQEELADKVGYTSKSSINKIEKGLVDLSRSKVSEFAEVFGVSISYLMGWEEKEKEQAYDKETEKILEELRTRPELKMLFSVSGKCTKEEIIKAAKIIETIHGE